MLLWLLAAQGLALPEDLIPELPLPLTRPDPAFAEQVRAALDAPEWAWSEIENLRATDATRELALATFVDQADDRALRLLAVLGAGCTPEGALTHAFLQRSCGALPEEAAVACLLAPSSVPTDWWPALGHLAARTVAPMSVRAAALSRLLESSCDAAWPWARAVLLTGTAHDQTGPGMDWRRAGRYELPKRLIVAALDLRARATGEPMSGFEPNAAWEAQEVVVRAMDERFRARAQPRSEPPSTLPWHALLRRAALLEPEAQSALALLAPAVPGLMRAGLASGDPRLTLAVRRALDERP